MKDFPALDHDLGETTDILRETVRDFAAAEIAPRAAEIDRANEFPRDLWPQLGGIGLLGITVALIVAMSFSLPCSSNCSARPSTTLIVRPGLVTRPANRNWGPRAGASRLILTSMVSTAASAGISENAA